MLQQAALARLSCPGLRIVSVVSVPMPGRFIYEWIQWNATRSALSGWVQTHPPFSARTPWVKRLLAIEGDVLVPNMWGPFYRIRQQPIFQYCRQPKLSPPMESFTQRLERSLVARGLEAPFACLHWRVGDMLCGMGISPCTKQGVYAFANGSFAGSWEAEVLRAINLLCARCLS